MRSWPPHCVSVTLRQQLGRASFLGSESIFPDIKRRWQCLTAAGGKKDGIQHNPTVFTQLGQSSFCLSFERFSLYFQTLGPVALCLHVCLRFTLLCRCSHFSVVLFSLFFIFQDAGTTNQENRGHFFFSFQHNKDIFKATFSQKILSASPSAGQNQTSLSQAWRLKSQKIIEDFQGAGKTRQATLVPGGSPWVPWLNGGKLKKLFLASWFELVAPFLVSGWQMQVCRNSVTTKPKAWFEGSVFPP